MEVLEEREGTIARKEVHEIAGDGRHAIEDAGTWRGPCGSFHG